jgi:hypothetical protein
MKHADAYHVLCPLRCICESQTSYDMPFLQRSRMSQNKLDDALRSVYGVKKIFVLPADVSKPFYR